MLGFHQEIWRRQLVAALRYWLLYPAAVLLSGMLIDRLLGLPRLPLPLPGLGLVVGGWLVIRRATTDLEKLGGGTPSPFRPPKSLVTEGSYGWCRHPMWLGYDLCALGVILLAGSPSSLLVSLPVFLGYQIRLLAREERILAARFKRRYSAYRRRTPMLMPGLRPGRAAKR